MKNMLERAVLLIIVLALFFRLIAVRITGIITYYAPGLIQGVNQAADVIIAVIFLTAAGLFVIKLAFNKETFPKTVIDIPLLIFIATAELSLAYSADRYLTLPALVILLGNVAVFYTLVSCLNSAYRTKLFMMALVSLALVASALGLIHYFFIYGIMVKMDAYTSLSAPAKHMININRIGSVFGWPNILAGFLGLVIPISFTQIFYQKKMVDKLCMAAATAILVYAMFLTYSILCWASFIAASIIFGPFLLRYDRLKTYMLFITVLLGAVFFLIVLRRLDIFTASSFGSRIKYFQSALTIIKAHPILGTGFDTFGSLLKSSYPAQPEGYSRYVHNSYLQIWLETGIAGLLSFLLVIYSAFKYGIASLKKMPSRGDTVLLIGLLWGIAAFTIDNLFNFTLLCPQTSVFWWVTLAIMFSFARQAA